jgi:hypothetical protein
MIKKMKQRNKVIKFFEYKSKLKVKEQTQINNDLGFAGLDADCMLEDFMKEFNVDLKGLDYERYFVSRLGLEYLFLRIFNKKKLLREPLTVKHMVLVAKRGRWIDPKEQGIPPRE